MLVHSDKHFLTCQSHLYVRYIRCQSELHQKRLHYPQPVAFLSNAHAQSVVLLWTAVGENGSTHARAAGKTFNDFVDFKHFMIVLTEHLTA